MEKIQNEQVPQRDSQGRFVKGNKGGGRTPIPKDVKEMLRAATPDAVKLLISTMNDEEEKLQLRLDCCKEILNRVYGKSTQPIDGVVDSSVLVTLSEELKEYAV